MEEEKMESKQVSYVLQLVCVCEEEMLGSAQLYDLIKSDFSTPEKHKWVSDSDFNCVYVFLSVCVRMLFVCVCLCVCVCACWYLHAKHLFQQLHPTA